MKIIEWSSKKFGNLQIMVDDEDYEDVKQYSWGVMTCKTSKVKYVKARHVSKENPRKYYSMHRFLLGVDDPKIFVDHRDGNGLNNQKSNLRISTLKDNCRNRGKQKNNSSGFKGVFVIKNTLTNSYRASLTIRDGSKRKHICSKIFKTPEEAARKYNELARQYHGEFAYQNAV